MKYLVMYDDYNNPDFEFVFPCGIFSSREEAEAQIAQLSNDEKFREEFHIQYLSIYAFEENKQYTISELCEMV